MEESVVSSCILEMCTKSICFHPRRRASPTVSDQGPQGRALLRLCSAGGLLGSLPQRVVV